MPGLYARWMDRWERKLATRDTNRIERPFEWGADWLRSVGFPAFPAEMNGDAPSALAAFVHKALADSEVKQLLQQFGFEAAPGTPEQFAEVIRADAKKYAEIVRRTGATAD